MHLLTAARKNRDCNNCNTLLLKDWIVGKSNTWRNPLLYQTRNVLWLTAYTALAWRRAVKTDGVAMKTTRDAVASFACYLCLMNGIA